MSAEDDFDEAENVNIQAALFFMCSFEAPRISQAARKFDAIQILSSSIQRFCNMHSSPPLSPKDLVIDDRVDSD